MGRRFVTRSIHSLGRCCPQGSEPSLISQKGAARASAVPIFFTTHAYDPHNPPSPHDKKLQLQLSPGDERLFELDPRLERRAKEKLLRKPYASCFKGTNLHEMLTGLGVDTLIVTGMSTSHCVYATCRDATDSFRVSQIPQFTQWMTGVWGP